MMRPSVRLLAPAVLGLAAVALLLLDTGVSSFVESIDTYNPTPHLPTDLAIGILVALVIAYSILVWPIPPADRNLVWWAWWAHVFIAFGPLLYLESIEDSIDGFRHYRQVMDVGSPWEILFSGSDTRIVDTLLWFPLHLLGGSFQASKLIFILPGLVGALFLARAARYVVGPGDRRPLALFLFFPSFLLWGSFLNKEALTGLAIGLYVYGIVRTWHAPSRAAVLYAVAGVLLAATLRPWLVFLLVAPLVVFPLVRLRAWGKPGIVGALVVVVVATASLSSVLERFEATSIDRFVAKVDEMSHYFGESTATGRQAPPFRDIGDVLAFLPIGMFTILFLPLPWQGDHILIRAGGIEGLLLIAAFWGGIALAIARRRTAQLRSPLFLWLVLLLAVWAAAYTFPIYQNAGLSMRTRTMMVPILLLVPLVLHGRARREAAVLHVATPGTASVLAAGSSDYLERTFGLRTVPGSSWGSLMREFAQSRPAIVQTQTGSAASRGMAVALIMGVPLRVHIASESAPSLRERGARLLATHVIVERTARAADRKTRPIGIAALPMGRFYREELQALGVKP